MKTLDQLTKKRFKNLSDQQLINRINKTPDFGWDDEGHELGRRNLSVERQNDNLVIIKTKAL